MENASKALLMAAGVLIAVLVLTLIIYLYSTFSETKRANIEQLNQTQLESFNGKYLAYDGRTDLTYYDIYNVTLMAEKDNKENSNKISVHLNSLDGTELKSANLLNKIKEINGIDGIMEEKPFQDTDGRTVQKKDLIKYTCKVYIGYTKPGNKEVTEGKVNKILFNKTP